MAKKKRKKKTEIFFCAGGTGNIPEVSDLHRLKRQQRRRRTSRNIWISMAASDQDIANSEVFNELLDIIIVDVASECHRIARLGLDRNLDEVEEEIRLSAEARAKVAEGSNNVELNGKYASDIFGQTHPAIASEIFDCMKCGRSIGAGRFAPHLEKCMGKGRKARLKATRSSTATQRNHAASPYTRSSNGRPSVADNDHINGTTEAP